MASKKAIVQYDNQKEELRPGDTLVGVSAASTFSAVNGNAGSIAKGQPVYISAANEVDLSDPSADASKDVAGMVADVLVAAAASGTVQNDGILNATVAEWDAVLGQVGPTGLLPGTRYIADPDNPGQMMPIGSVTNAGDWVVPLGKALSTEDFLIDIDEPFKRN